MKFHSLLKIAIITACILAAPAIAMQITDEVNWTLGDFIIAAILIFTTGTAIQLLSQKINNIKAKRVLIAIVLFLLILIWAELAVGVFGSRFAGS